MSSQLSSEEKLYRIRHSLSHVMAMAVLEMFPEAKLAIGPPVDNGFYYDVDLSRSLQPEDLKELEKRMEKILKQDISFQVSSHTIAEGIEQFKNQPYKKELIEDLGKAGETAITYYTSGSFVDLCKGPHVEHVKDIPYGCFELSHAAGAYWRGDEKRPMLQRLYGLAFASKDELKAYKMMIEEAKKRDHRKLGAELDLFTFSDLVGSGLPLWTPKGNTLRLLLDEYVWKLRQARGYERVEIPHITKKELYIKSGHWEKFQDELFKITTREGHEFVMKPMNCPHHTQIFARKRWSYREMPQRYANTTMCYRDEQTGELNGLSRVRSFTQDDAHVFCRYNQAKEELSKIWDVVEEFYKTFNFDLQVRLSFHDPKNMDAYLGGPEVWKKAEAELQELVEERGSEYVVALGEAAFYGPKIDFLAKDSLGREWQVATIQLDMNMPERFDLTYIGEDGAEQPVLMIHAAIMGSIERFLSILIEHLAGNFPFWLAPVQVAVIAVSDQFNDAAHQVAHLLTGAGFRVSVDDSSESVGKKIRKSSLEKIPAKMVIGQQELDTLDKGGEWQIKVNGRADLAERFGEDARSLQVILETMHELVSERAL
jgi:threonyl-tRNA synthetase